MTRLLKLIALLLALIFVLNSCFAPAPEEETAPPADNNGSYEPEPLAPYEERNGNIPYFTASEITTVAYEYYSPLDSLERCGTVHACIGTETMPPQGDKRGDIGHVYPSGWVQQKYDTALVEGGYLYNRSHLIGWQLTDEDDNECNLITGTRYFNVEGMLPFENMVADYIKETGNHVMYRVTPDFKENNLVASGVLMEAWSVEDDGEGVCFCVYVFNYQPGVVINYKTGENQLGSTEKPPVTSEDNGTEDAPGESTPDLGEGVYILNTSSKKFHKPTCASVNKISESNKQTYTGDREDLIAESYSPCGTCKP